MLKIGIMKFFNNSVSEIEWNSFFRISIALYCLLNLFSFWADIPNILLENAFIKPEVIDLVFDGYSPTLVDLHHYLTNLGITLAFDDFVYLVIYVYIFMLGLLLLGAFTRVAAIASFILQIIILKSMNYYLYGADYFASMALFYCIIFPKGKFSLDYMIKEFQINQLSLKWSLLLLQAHLCVIYFFSGLDKGLGINWYNGESVWRAVSGHNYNGLISLADYDLPNFIYISIGILTLITETFYPVFINYSKTRKLWLTLTISMHVSIILFMGLYFFGTLMIILNVAAYYIPYLKKDNSNASSEYEKDLENQLAYEK